MIKIENFDESKIVQRTNAKDFSEYLTVLVDFCEKKNYTLVGFDIDDESEWSGVRTSLVLNCPKHGDFKTTISKIQTGYGCPHCGGKPLSTEEFKTRVENLHPGKFDFPEDLVYVNAHTTVTLFCKQHNGTFETTPNNLLHKRNGCNVCNRRKHTQESFIAKCKENYGDQFSFDKVVYTKNSDKVTVYCNHHGGYVDIMAGTLLAGKTGCGVCRKLKIKKSKDTE